MTSFFFCWGWWSDLDKFRRLVQNDTSTAVMWSKSETRCRIPIWRTFGWIQRHVIPEPSATLQGAVTWRNQCRDRATLQGVRIPSTILKIVFTIYYYFLFLMQFRLWQAVAFVSSPIHLLLLRLIHTLTYLFTYLLTYILTYLLISFLLSTAVEKKHVQTTRCGLHFSLKGRECYKDRRSSRWIEKRPRIYSTEIIYRVLLCRMFWCR